MSKPSFEGLTQLGQALNHTLGHKTNLKKFKSTEIISSIFSDHDDMKLEINHRKRNEEKQLHGDQITRCWKPNGSKRKS